MKHYIEGEEVMITLPTYAGRGKIIRWHPDSIYSVIHIESNRELLLLASELSKIEE